MDTLLPNVFMISLLAFALAALMRSQPPTTQVVYLPQEYDHPRKNTGCLPLLLVTVLLVLMVLSLS